MFFIKYYFKNQVQLERIAEMLAYNFSLSSQGRTLFNTRMFLCSFMLMWLSITVSLILMYEYEVKRFSDFEGVYETFYFLIITMTTTGFGFLTAQSHLGRFSIVIGVPVYLAIQAFFLIAWAKFSKFNQNEY